MALMKLVRLTSPVMRSFVASIHRENIAQKRNFSSLRKTTPINLTPSLLNCNQSQTKRPLLLTENGQLKSSRSVTKYSLKTGKKRSVLAVVARFFRLDTGLWIRRRAGCQVKVHKKKGFEKWQGRQHVVCNKTQCIMLDKMVHDNFKKKKYFIDDPFEPYQVRNNFDWVLPKRKR